MHKSPLPVAGKYCLLVVVFDFGWMVAVIYRSLKHQNFFLTIVDSLCTFTRSKLFYQYPRYMKGI